MLEEGYNGVTSSNVNFPLLPTKTPTNRINLPIIKTKKIFRDIKQIEQVSCDISLCCPIVKDPFFYLYLHIKSRFSCLFILWFVNTFPLDKLNQKYVFSPLYLLESEKQQL